VVVVPPPRQRRRRRRSGSRHGAKAGGARAQGCLRQESARLVRAMAAAGERERERRRWALGRAWGVPRRVRVDAPRG
jgi:hypothetical protein